MLKKLQIKLLSNSGELLNVVTCHAGQVSVFRANSPSEIRPYQRALTGSAGRERFSVSLDGGDFSPEDHTLIGFGEPAPHQGMTTREFLRSAGMLDGSIEGLLLSYGLQHAGDTLCTDLSPDEERRVRLLAGASMPGRILIVNEPFEPIAASWRERFAELLTSFARSQSGMVVVASLSYRPECWIENDSIARLQVGQTSQRTIGFASQNSSTKLIQELRQMLGDNKQVDELLNPKLAQSSSQSASEATPALAAAALGAAAITSHEPLQGTPIAPRKIWSHTIPLRSQLVALGGLALAALGGLYIFRQPSSDAQTAALPPSSLESPTFELPTNPQEPPSAAQQGTESLASNSSAVGDVNASQPIKPQADASLAALRPAPPSGPKLLVDEYPEAIRASLLDTARGALRIPDSTGPDSTGATSVAASAPKEVSKAPGGNLFALLEGASSKEQEGGYRAPEGQSAYEAPDDSEQVSQTQEDLETRREEIRQKFLEAIRTAAERRDQQVEE